jgi:hypothetical protein
MSQLFACRASPLFTHNICLTSCRHAGHDRSQSIFCKRSLDAHCQFHRHTHTHTHSHTHTHTHTHTRTHTHTHTHTHFILHQARVVDIIKVNPILVDSVLSSTRLRRRRDAASYYSTGAYMFYATDAPSPAPTTQNNDHLTDNQGGTSMVTAQVVGMILISLCTFVSSRVWYRRRRIAKRLRDKRRQHGTRRRSQLDAPCATEPYEWDEWNGDVRACAPSSSQGLSNVRVSKKSSWTSDYISIDGRTSAEENTCVRLMRICPAPSNRCVYACTCIGGDRAWPFSIHIWTCLESWAACISFCSEN